LIFACTSATAGGFKPAVAVFFATAARNKHDKWRREPLNPAKRLYRGGDHFMRAILVDDERLALAQLKKILERHVGGVQVIGMYSDPTRVVAIAEKLAPDVVFLDIHMPGMSGVKLGELLQERVPAVEIVFVTGYDQYAVHAFEMYALDYIMKPVQPERLSKTMQRLRVKIGDRANKDDKGEREADPPLICCFNQIRVQLSGEKPKFIKWRTSKAQELFAYLLHHRDRIIERGTLIELLWPDFVASKAAQQLYTTVYHIRQALRNSGLEMVTIASGNPETGYRLTTGTARIDSDEWEKQVHNLGTLDKRHIEQYEKVLELYKGDYFGDFEFLWAEYERERLRRMWLNLARSVSGFYMEQQQPQAAIRINRLIQQMFPYLEESYFALMLLYDSSGDSAGVEEQYWLLTSRMEREMESAASETISEWYASWKTRSSQVMQS
jgi:two-component SAPR family response regulator